jgi:hypothetical protein
MSLNKIDKSKSNLKVKVRSKKKIQQNTESKNRRAKEKDICKGANVIFGLDNGVTGSISCILPSQNYIDYLETPAITCNDYTQEIKKINRIDIYALKDWFEKHINFAKTLYKDEIKVIVILERPMVNSQRFRQSLIAVRAFEATLIVLEMLELNYIVIDSKKWQHHFFGKDTSQIDLKKSSEKLSLEILDRYDEKGNLYEMSVSDLKKLVSHHGDGDGLLMCKYAEEKLI